MNANGFVLVFAVIAIVTVIVAALHLCFRNCPGWFAKTVRTLRGPLFSMMSKAFLCAYLGLSIGAFTGLSTGVNIAFSAILVNFLGLMTCLIAVLFEVKSDNDGDGEGESEGDVDSREDWFVENRKVFGNLYKTLVTTRRSSLHFTTVFLCRRFAVALAIVMCKTLILQVAAVTFLSLLMIMYIITFEPFLKKVDYVIELVNEVAILAVSYSSLGFADNIQSAQAKNIHGWITIGIICFQILVCLSIQVPFVVLSLIKGFKDKLCKKSQPNKAVKEGAAAPSGIKPNSAAGVEMPVPAVSKKESGLENIIEDEGNEEDGSSISQSQNR